MSMSRLILTTAIALALGSTAQASGIELDPAPAQPYSRDDWGSVGLLQTPTARMAPEGELAFTASVVSPYNRYNISLQPFPWLEATYRYSNVVGKDYGPEHFSGDQNYKDKSIDVKVRLWEESRWLPALAFGMRDIGGTGLFSSEYLVANKRLGNFDVSLGAATGYMGNRGDLSNPLSHIDEKYNSRENASTTPGALNSSHLFHGRVGIFGGINYQKPGSRWQYKLELDGNDYKKEPRPLKIEQDSPINLGVVYEATDNIRLSLGWERGNTALASISFHGRPGRSRPGPLLPHYRPNTKRVTQASELAVGADAGPGENWVQLANLTAREARIGVLAIGQRQNELVVQVEGSRFYQDATTLGRTARILAAGAPADIDWITLQHGIYGVPMAEHSVHRDTFLAWLDGKTSTAQLAARTEVNRPVSWQEQTHYRQDRLRYFGRPGIGYRQVMGGAEGLLYEIDATYEGFAYLGSSTWWKGRLETTLFGTFDRFRFSGTSEIPRVRTYMREYATTSDIRLPNFEVTTLRKLGQNTYASAYAGLLESMFGGVGAEILHRPIGQRWAVGANINWVKQRDFAQDFGFRDYHTVTGHMDLHYRFGQQHRVDATLSAGRYLAGDWGVTANLARRFDNGVTFGAWASKTNLSSAEFGEGSFDKGIYFSVPMEFILPLPSRSSAGFYWRPIQRDGAAMLQRSFPLHSLTESRDSELFFSNLDTIGR